MDVERRWKAVAGRDANFDGRFVFAVRSTKIYCRPSCPARRPRREQELMPRPIAALAEELGLRPQRRGSSARSRLKCAREAK
jgi:AraC family transcriptional regulator of adaptative response/methylated-DNA-[protein]-cysteine methyltransferase